MRLFVFAAAIAVLAAAPAGAETSMSYTSGNRCLSAVDVDHTHVVDQSNILFYMRDGKVWSTHLTPACVNLTLSGFKMVGHPDQFCANSQTIEVLNGSAVCRLGNFEPYNDRAKQRS